MNTKHFVQASKQVSNLNERIVGEDTATRILTLIRGNNLLAAVYVSDSH